MEEAPGASFGVPLRHSVELWLVSKELLLSVSEIDLGEDRGESRFGGAPGRTRGRVLVENTAYVTAA